MASREGGMWEELRSRMADEFEIHFAKLRKEAAENELQCQLGSVRELLMDDVDGRPSLLGWFEENRGRLDQARRRAAATTSGSLADDRDDDRGGEDIGFVCEVRDIDSLVAAKDLLDEGFERPCVLNMANAQYAGGGVEGGCLAQEEELCRRTDLYMALCPQTNRRITRRGKQYKIANRGCIYSPNVRIMTTRRRTPDPSIPIYMEPTPIEGIYPRIGVVSVAMYRVKASDSRSDQISDEMVYEKLEMSVLAPLRHGHDTIVLGALGCGAFRNDPTQVASQYAKVLSVYGKYFKKIVFAVLAFDKRGKRNLEVFKKILNRPAPAG